MLFNRKRARIYVESEFSQWYPPAREFLPYPTDWKDKQLGNDVANREGGLGRISMIRNSMAESEKHVYHKECVAR
jgi:hypothetical protein